jgi:dephospho-CoA kinase
VLKLKKIAVTGGLSSGKTTVCNLFGQLGAQVVSADDIVHQLLSLTTPIGQRIVHLFGNNVVKNGKLDRQLIAKIAFHHPDLLMQLEKILHPAVFTEMDKLYLETEKKQQARLFAAEIPLLFEAGQDKYFDAIVTVMAPEDICQQRFHSKGGSLEEYRQRMNRQMTPQEKSALSLFTIENAGDLDHLKSIVTQLFHVFTQEELRPNEPRRTRPQ